MLITDRVISLGILGAGLNQRLRNPLRAVQAFLELTPGHLRQNLVDLDRLRDPSFWRDFHALVVKQAGRIADLLGEIDVAAGATAGAPTETKPEAAIKEVLEARLRDFTGQGINVHADVPDSLPALPGDPGVFRKLIDLVCRGELLALSPGTSVGFAASVGVDGARPVGLQITVKDNGAGLPAEAMRSVFDPFFIRTEGPQDFGLNLMGVYFLVYHYGGRITFRNTSGAGLEYVIELPLKPAEALTGAASGHEFVTKVLMNDTLWERLLPS
jgi:two-component system, probable response regulator PhcQ